MLYDNRFCSLAYLERIHSTAKEKTMVFPKKLLIKIFSKLFSVDTETQGLLYFQIRFVYSNIYQRLKG